MLYSVLLGAWLLLPLVTTEEPAVVCTEEPPPLPLWMTVGVMPTVGK